MRMMRLALRSRQLGMGATWLLGLALSLALAPQARAFPVQYQVTGTISSVIDFAGLVTGLVSVGMSFTGTVSWDTSIPDVDPNIGFGRYESDSLLAVSMSVGVLDLATDPLAGSVANVVDSNPGSTDAFGVFSEDPIVTGAAITVSSLQFLLDALSGVALTNDDLPVALDLANWDRNRALGFVIVEGADVAVVSGDIETLTLLPETSTLTLIALGVLLAARPTRCVGAGAGAVRPRVPSRV